MNLTKLGLKSLRLTKRVKLGIFSQGDYYVK